MNGVLAGIVGVWALCQVFGGGALERLGVLGGTAPSTTQKPDLGNIPPQDLGPDGRLKL